MKYTTKLTDATAFLVAYDSIKRGFDAMSKRADRRLKPYANEVDTRLRKGEKFGEDSIVTADYRFEDEQKKARTTMEAVKEFKKRHPEYGKILQGLINETRKSKMRYLEFGLAGKCDLPESIYFDALRQIGIPEVNLDQTYQTVADISDILQERRQQGLTSMLMK